MPQTVEKIVRKALQKLQVHGATQPIKPEDMSDAIDALNAMVRRWEADGIALGWSPVSSPSDVVPAPDEAEEALIYNLAIRLAPDFGVDPMPAVIGGANTFKAALERDQAVATPLRPILAVPEPADGNMGAQGFGFGSMLA